MAVRGTRSKPAMSVLWHLYAGAPGSNPYG
jgi:hypothetical protein